MTTTAQPPEPAAHGQHTPRRMFVVRSTLKSHIARLDPSLSAREMLASAQRSGYATTISSIYAARTALGIAKARGQYERKTPRVALDDTSSAPTTDIEMPSDETIFAGLIVRIGLDRARTVLARVEHQLQELAHSTP